jgi:hypothetical protein
MNRRPKTQSRRRQTRRPDRAQGGASAGPPSKTALEDDCHERESRRTAQRRRVDNGVGVELALTNAVLALLLLALAGRVLLLLTGLRLPALLLLSRLLAAALLLTGLLVGSLRRVRILVRIIHLSTSWVKIQHNAFNDYRPNYNLIKK